jgi:hypothetical protein
LYFDTYAFDAFITRYEPANNFLFAHPHKKILTMQKSCTSLYGSNLWDLGSTEAEMAFAAVRTGLGCAPGLLGVSSILGKSGRKKTNC